MAEEKKLEEDMSWHHEFDIQAIASRWFKCNVLRLVIYNTSTGGGSAAPRVAKPDGVVDGIFP